MLFLYKSPLERYRARQCTRTRAYYTMRMRRAGSEDWGMGMRLYLCGILKGPGYEASAILDS